MIPNFRTAYWVQAFLMVLISAAPLSTWAATEESLEQKMKSLNLSDRAPAQTNEDKLYSVQQRMSPLKRASEFTLGGGVNLSGDSFLNTKQLDVAYRFHFNDRWAIGASYAFISNSLSSAAERLRDSAGIVPDVPYAISQLDLFGELNAFYGKFRFSSARVMYFDQYFTFGLGRVHMDVADETEVVGGLGFAVWLGQQLSLRVGLEDHYANEPYPTGETPTHNIFAHIDMGLLLKGK